MSNFWNSTTVFQYFLPEIYLGISSENTFKIISGISFRDLFSKKPFLKCLNLHNNLQYSLAIYFCSGHHSYALAKIWNLLPIAGWHNPESEPFYYASACHAGTSPDRNAYRCIRTEQTPLCGSENSSRLAWCLVVIHVSLHSGKCLACMSGFCLQC